MIWWMTTHASGPRTLSVHSIPSASPISSRMASAQSLGRLAVNLRFGVTVQCSTQRNLYKVVYLQRISFGSGFVLKFLDACSGQAEVVSPKHIKISFGCNGLGLLPLWFSCSVSSFYYQALCV